MAAGIGCRVYFIEQNCDFDRIKIAEKNYIMLENIDLVPEEVGNIIRFVNKIMH